VARLMVSNIKNNELNQWVMFRNLSYANKPPMPLARPSENHIARVRPGALGASLGSDLVEIQRSTTLLGTVRFGHARRFIENRARQPSRSCFVGELLVRAS
jgi:hypothetical protein